MSEDGRSLKRQRLFRGVQGRESRNMELVTLENVDQRAVSITRSTWGVNNVSIRDGKERAFHISSIPLGCVHFTLLADQIKV